jgi:hypothetical protein
MGNEESSLEFKQSEKFLLDIDKSYHFSNDILKGKIKFYVNTTNCKIIFKKIEYWYNLNEFVERKETKIDNLSTDNFVIDNKNKNDFEFKVNLNNLEPSFEYYYDQDDLIRVCFLRYILRIEIDNNIINDEIICIKRIPIIDFYKENSLIIKTKIKEWFGLSKKGFCNIKIELQKTYFKVNENIDVKISVDNSNCELKIKSLIVYILRKILTLEKNSNIVKYSFDEKYNKIEQTINLIPYSQDRYNFSLKFQEKLQVAPKNRFGLGNNYINAVDYIPTCFGKIVQNLFSICAEIKYDSKVINDHPFLSIPIFVGNKEDNNKSKFYNDIHVYESYDDKNK